MTELSQSQLQSQSTQSDTQHATSVHSNLTVNTSTDRNMTDASTSPRNVVSVQYELTPIEQWLVDELFTRNKATVLRAELDCMTFVNDATRHQYELFDLTSYARLVWHRLAERFELDHKAADLPSSIGLQRAVVVSKTTKTRTPSYTLTELCEFNPQYAQQFNGSNDVPPAPAPPIDNNDTQINNSIINNNNAAQSMHTNGKVQMLKRATPAQPNMTHSKYSYHTPQSIMMHNTVNHVFDDNEHRSNQIKYNQYTPHRIIQQQQHHSSYNASDNSHASNQPNPFNQLLSTVSTVLSNPQFAVPINEFANLAMQAFQTPSQHHGMHSPSNQFCSSYNTTASHTQQPLNPSMILAAIPNILSAAVSMLPSPQQVMNTASGVMSSSTQSSHINNSINDSMLNNNRITDFNTELNILCNIIVDVDDDNYIVDVYSRGFTRNEIALRIENNIILVISGNKSHTNTSHIANQSSFERKIRLPTNVDKSQIHAKHTNGVLRITIKQNISKQQQANAEFNHTKNELHKPNLP